MRAMAPRTPPIAVLVLALTSACSPQPGEGGERSPSKAEAGAPASEDASDAPKPKSDGDSGARAQGRVLADAPIALGSVLGHAPADAEKVLGEPIETGSNRISCVRFLPERVFFACEQEARAYTDRSGKLEGIRVEYEDGKAASISMTGLVGEGEFSPEKALAIAGLELPGEYRTIEPQAGVKVWDYWNTEARLVLDGKQYRVQVSVIDGEWPRSKVEVMINHPLSDDEKSRIKPAGE